MTPPAPEHDFADLRAMYINTTLKRSPEVSNTQGLIEVSAEIMRRQGVNVDLLRAVDQDIAIGVQPDMSDHGWGRDEWPEIFDVSSPPTSWSSAPRSGSANDPRYAAR
jgi:hypothetical protein